MVTVDLFQFNSASYPTFCCLFMTSPGHPAKISSVPSVGLSQSVQWPLFTFSDASLFTVVGFFSSCLLKSKTALFLVGQSFSFLGCSKHSHNICVTFITT